MEHGCGATSCNTAPGQSAATIATQNLNQASPYGLIATPASSTGICWEVQKSNIEGEMEMRSGVQKWKAMSSVGFLDPSEL